METGQSKTTPGHRNLVGTVLIVSDSYLPHAGGGPRHVAALKKGLEANGFKVLVAAPATLHLWYRFLWSPLITPKLIWLGLRHRVSVVHSQGYYTGLVGFVTAKLIGAASLHTIHGANTQDTEKGGLKYWLERFLLFYLPYDQVFSVTSHIARFTQRPFTLISNGVDISLASIQPTPVAGRVLCIGRNDPIKNHTWLKSVFPEIKKKVPEARLRIITGGKSSKQLQKEYQQAAVFVLPSRSEGQPLTVLEAMAAGVPVVATRVGGVPDLIEDGVTGLLVPSRDSQALVNAIVEILTKPKLAMKLSKAAKENLDRYTWDNLIKITITEYQRWLK